MKVKDYYQLYSAEVGAAQEILDLYEERWNTSTTYREYENRAIYTCNNMANTVLKLTRKLAQLQVELEQSLDFIKHLQGEEGDQS